MSKTYNSHNVTLSDTKKMSSDGLDILCDNTPQFTLSYAITQVKHEKQNNGRLAHNEKNEPILVLAHKSTYEEDKKSLIEKEYLDDALVVARQYAHDHHLDLVVLDMQSHNIVNNITNMGHRTALLASEIDKLPDDMVLHIAPLGTYLEDDETDYLKAVTHISKKQLISISKPSEYESYNNINYVGNKKVLVDLNYKSYGNMTFPDSNMGRYVHFKSDKFQEASPERILIRKLNFRNIQSDTDVAYHDNVRNFTLPKIDDNINLETIAGLNSKDKIVIREKINKTEDAYKNVYYELNHLNNYKTFNPSGVLALLHEFNVLEHGVYDYTKKQFVIDKHDSLEKIKSIIKDLEEYHHDDLIQYIERKKWIKLPLYENATAIENELLRDLNRDSYKLTEYEKNIIEQCEQSLYKEKSILEIG